MRCPQCNNDMRIAASFLQHRETPDGAGEIVSVVDFACTDPQCPNGKTGLPVARQARPASGPASYENAVTCCGMPLCYHNGENYWVPDGVNSEISETESRLAVTCPNCGQVYQLEIGQ